ncbi:hypothetical protein LEN26_016286 [Aphanomyces euteiches]|nr:hypothetical protein LEN26_016286 [Aphanomyces euteiches]KAH9105345.1 hypothetical protein AeMF1_018796 [Aphanomyces euteiches]KAH9192116.1 hypothetical protein AeNC1_005904 [Aphanomyces euteiches]
MGNSSQKPKRNADGPSRTRSMSEGNLPSLENASVPSRTSSIPPPSAPQRNSLAAPPSGGIERGQEAVEETSQQLSYWYMVRHGYDQMVNLIIRPPRAEYSIEDLGPTSFLFSGQEFERVDFAIPVRREGIKNDLLIRCSQWQRAVSDRPKAADGNPVPLPCVIYLHGNSSCRLEALSILRCVLSTGASVISLDCIGCGLSDGDYITLGYYERDDVQAVIEYLRSQGTVSSIALWGRSMGAVTALLHADRDPSIAGIVVDSAFANLDQLVHEVVEHGRREGYTIPTFAVKIVMRFIRSSVWKRAHFDLKELSPIDHVDKSFIPALFVAAHKDSFIRPHHSEALFAKYAGDKNLIKVSGDHNSPRPQYLLDSVGIFLQSVMCIDESLALHDPFAGAMLPWAHDSVLLARLFEASFDRAMNAVGEEGQSELPQLPQTSWACRLCTFINPPGCTHCMVCEALHDPQEPRSEVENEVSQLD